MSKGVEGREKERERQTDRQRMRESEQEPGGETEIEKKWTKTGRIGCRLGKE